MKLIKVETKGFKSFSEKVILDFDGGIVGIVGPNGSGKSNINDAIKWVLGEQSIKSLRGDNSDDVIFSGSKLMQPSDKAEVSLTFDNSEKRVSLPHKFITITRIVERGKGENKYFINGDEARLKDIKEIAMESGIGKSSLAIISQGTISNIAEATPEERRLIFEEAAGISKYKSRKDEAIRKLDSTTDALEKVKTVVVELEKQLNPLRRQAEKAKIYLAKKDELKDVEIGLIVDDIKHFGKKLEELNAELEDVLSTKDNLNSRINGLERDLKEKTSYKLNLENEIINLSNKYNEINDKLRDIEIRNSQASQRRQMIINGEITATASSRIQVIEEELKELESKASKYKIWEEKSISDISAKRVLVADAQAKLSSMHYEADNAKQKLLHFRTRLAIMIDHRDNKTNLYKGVKQVLNHANLFPGLHGIVSDLLQVDAQYASAMEAILGASSQHIVVDNSDTAVKAVNFLKENNAGKATFIPLNTIQPKGVVNEHLMVAKTRPGLIGVASDLISTKPKFEILKKFLLGNILIADTVESANAISKLLQARYNVVSLDGDMVRAGGVISGGERNKNPETFGVDDQIKKLEAAIPSLEKTLHDIQSEYSKYSNLISEEQSIIAELNIETAKVREKRSIIEQNFAHLKETYESISEKKFEHTSLEDVFANAQTLDAEKISLQTLLKAKRDSIMSINNDLSQITIQKTELEKSIRSIIDSSSSKMLEKSQGEFIMNSQKRRLSEEYEMTIEAAMKQFRLEIDYDEAKAIVNRLRTEIKDLGSVNIDSISTFEEINERYMKLKNSEEELYTAQQTIISAISEMDKIIVSRLDETIQGVNSEFRNVFTTMFGGGHAEIKYTNPNNLLETGVDVIAQPPGKTVKNLKLFSGGEKALIAISLLFAILKSKPLPLCILDEVEAALDDANVVRFANYLQELKAQTQFIVITHRVGTMANVDHLFGATMQKRGSTTFFTVKLEDAKKLVEE